MASLLVGLAGCSQRATRLDADTTERIITTDSLDVDDAVRAADVLTESMLQSPIFADGEKPVIEVSTFINNTDTQIDPDVVLKKIRVVLTNSQLARVLTDRGQDTVASDEAKRSQFRGEAQEIRPDYTLSFKILDDRAKAGRVKELTYTFQMSLTEASTRIAAWEGEEIITKQGSRSAVGW